MKVGLLSMHRVANYGSFWQAYCLQRMISECGASTSEFIDIIPGKSETQTKFKKTFAISKIKRIPYYVFQYNKKKMFENYQTTMLGCKKEANYRDNYDAIIIGSDEVFNCAQSSPWGFSPQLYGAINNQNVNSYAACFGNTTLDFIIKAERDKIISESLNNLRNISVRDCNSEDIIKKLTGRNPMINLDPVIVGDLPDKLPDIKDKKYILVYSYDFRMSDPDVIEQVRTLAKKSGLKIISAGFYQDWVDCNRLPNPIELLSYFKNADYIVTDTFHGTIFSVRMHKKFVTVIRDQNQQKLGDLLMRIGMNDRKYSDGDSLVSNILEYTDYDKFEKLRKEERKRTELYLKDCLNR